MCPSIPAPPPPIHWTSGLPERQRTTGRVDRRALTDLERPVSHRRVGHRWRLGSGTRSAALSRSQGARRPLLARRLSSKRASVADWLPERGTGSGNARVPVQGAITSSGRRPLKAGGGRMPGPARNAGSGRGGPAQTAATPDRHPSQQRVYETACFHAFFNMKGTLDVRKSYKSGNRRN